MSFFYVLCLILTRQLHKQTGLTDHPVFYTWRLKLEERQRREICVVRLTN
jgi:hypothetical protein